MKVSVLKINRPDFKSIKSFEEFNRYYWYRKELSQICKSLGLEYRCTKQELNQIIEQYFQGNRVEKYLVNKKNPQTEVITINTSLIKCGFSFNEKFREFFATITGVTPFKFNANMAAAWRKVKSENDVNFTIKDLLKIYYGELDYVKYNNSSCQWNNFFKAFCLDEFSNHYSNKLKVAAILWNKVRDSKNPKVYTSELLSKYAYQIKKYHK